jgi:hypothetical protein
MEATRPAAAQAAKPAQSISPPETAPRTDPRHLGRVPAAGQAEAAQKFVGYGLPCIKCKLYYPANLDVCPTCQGTERMSPTVVPGLPRAQAATDAVPDTAVVEKEREAFLKEFKSQLFAAHAEVTNSPVVCTLGEHPAETPEAASVCKQCYEHLQERVDVCEAALHIDVKDAAEIVYNAVWADPSDPSKTYTNAASALLTELRKRAGIASMIGPFQPLGY